MNFYAFFFCEMFLVICRRCQLSDGDDDDCDGRELLRLVCKGRRDTPTLPARLSRTALSLFLLTRALSLSHGIPKCALSSSPSLSLSLSLPLVLFCANCLQHFLNASWSQHLKHFNLLLLSRSTLLLSHAPSSRSHSFSLSVCLQSLLSFCKNGCLCCACSLSVGVVVVAVGRNTVELEQQFAAI